MDSNISGLSGSVSPSRLSFHTGIRIFKPKL